jgi:hypothetical protein
LSENKVATVLGFIDQERHSMLIDGALRAMAMLRLIPKEDDISRILGYARTLSVNDGNRFWIVAASPGWPPKTIEGFLEDTTKSSRPDFQEAVLLAKSAKYKSWNPL